MATASLTLALGRGFAALVSAAWLMIAARGLAIAEFADLALLLALGAIFTIIGDLGLSLLVTETVAQAGAISRSTITWVLVRRVPASVAAAGCTAVAYLTVAADPRPAVPAIFAVSMVSTGVYTTYVAALRGLGRVGAEVTNEILSRLVVLALGLVALSTGGALTALVAAYAAADTASAVVLTAFSRRWVNSRDRTKGPALSWRRALPVAVGALLNNLYLRVDIWMLGLLSTPTAVALYAAAARLAEGATIPAGAVSSLSATVQARAGDRAPWAVAAGSIALVAPIGLLLAVLAEPVLELTFGPDFGPGASALAILGVAVAPAGAVLALLPLAALRRGTRFAMVMAAVLGLNVLLNWFTIPALGARGAAATTLVSQSLLLLVLWMLTRASPIGQSTAMPDR